MEFFTLRPTWIKGIAGRKEAARAKYSVSILAALTRKGHIRKMSKDRLNELYSGYDTQETKRACDVPDCELEGLYKAPKDRKHLDQHYWFCLEHIRGYNQTWDYYKGMSEAEIERERQEDAVWRRPTWKLGNSGNDFHLHGKNVHDGFGFFAKSEGKPGKPQVDAPTAKALRTLGLDPGADKTAIKTRYKTLAKQLHPDANNGDLGAEERFKQVNQAYNFLKKSFTS